MRRVPVLLLALIALNFALSVFMLDHQELRGDEAFSWNYIQGTPIDIVSRIVREGDPQPPLHYWLLWGWTQLTGDSEYVLRFPSVFLSVLLVPLIYQVGRKLWRSSIGLLAAAITAIHPQQIWLAQDARNMYTLALAFILIATYLLPDMLNDASLKHRVGYILCCTVAMYSHYYALFALLAHGGYVVATRHNARRWIAASLTIVLLVAPWIFIVLPVFARGQLANPGSLSFIQYTSSSLGDLLAGPSLPTTNGIVVAVVIGIFVLLPLFTRLQWRLFLIAAILIPFVGIYAITGLRSTFNSYYLIFTFPAVYILLAEALLFVLKKNRLIGALLVMLVAAIYANGLFNHYFDPRYSKTRGWREMAAHIEKSMQPGDGYLANFPDPVQNYYLRHIHLPYTMLPASPNFTPDEINATLTKLSYNRVWFVPIKAPQWDRDGYIQSRLLSTRISIEDQRFDEVRLMLFTRPDRAIPLNARFADGIELIGYTLTPNRLTLIWRSTATPSTDYTIFVHALANDGHIVAQHDAPPSTPTSDWKSNQMIIDVHEFDLPTDQALSIVVGMYMPSTAQRLTLQSAPTHEPDATLITTSKP